MLEPVGTALLAEQLRNGDPEAFSKLLDLYGSSMLRVARGYVSSRDLAEDVVQETWIAVFKGIHKFEGRASLRTWIFTILINVAKKHGLAERRHADTAVRSVLVFRYWAAPQQPLQVQQPVNMSVVVASAGRSQQSVWSKAVAL